MLLSQTEAINIYNLALLDLLDNGEFSDISEKNNDDFKTVLATVFRIIDSFLDQNHQSFVIFRGSEPRRHRLYRIIINRELNEISKKFLVLGVNDSVLFPFEMNTSYEFYLIRKHESNEKKIIPIPNLQEISLFKRN